MQPNYYLLRENLESGPYTIDELLLQGLKPTDLVWVNGRTNAWCHPSELEELTVSFSINREKLREVTPEISRQRIPKRPKQIRKDEIETRAEEIRKNILSQAVQKPSPKLEVEEDLSPTSFKIPDESIDLIVHKKKLTLPGAHVTAIGIMAIFIAGAFYGKDLWVDNSRFLDAVAKPFENSTMVTIPEKKETSVQPIFSLGALPVSQDSASSLVTIDSFAAKAEPVVPLPSPEPKKHLENNYQQAENDTPELKKETIVPVNLPTEKISKEPEPKKEIIPAEPEVKEPIKKAEPEAEKSPKPNTVQKKADTLVAAEPEKKRGFFGRLFKKKKSE
jgi:hypothetical protein